MARSQIVSSSGGASGRLEDGRASRGFRIAVRLRRPTWSGAEAVDAGRRAGPLAGELLGRHVRRRPQHGACPGLAAVELEVGLARLDAVVLRIRDRARDAPVEDIDLAEVAEHDVRRLEIAVDDPRAVRELDRETDIGEGAQEAPSHEHLVLLAGAQALQELGHRGPLQPLHHEVRLATPIDREIVNGDDRRMLEPPLHSRLAHEPGQLVGGRRLRPDPLDRHLATDLLVEREHDLAHAALPQE